MRSRRRQQACRHILDVLYAEYPRWLTVRHIQTKIMDLRKEQTGRKTSFLTPTMPELRGILNHTIRNDLDITDRHEGYDVKVYRLKDREVDKVDRSYR